MLTNIFKYTKFSIQSIINIYFLESLRIFEKHKNLSVQKDSTLSLKLIIVVIKKIRYVQKQHLKN